MILYPNFYLSFIPRLLVFCVRTSIIVFMICFYDFCDSILLLIVWQCPGWWFPFVFCVILDFVFFVARFTILFVVCHM